VLVILAFVVLPACFAAALLVVAYGPGPARRRALVAAQPYPQVPIVVLPAPATAENENVAAAIVENVATAPAPPAPRPMPTMNPALAPVVRPRAGPLPPLRRAARGTDAPPSFSAASPARPTASSARPVAVFEGEEPTLIDVREPGHRGVG
jgi:hypothetical protein